MRRLSAALAPRGPDGDGHWLAPDGTVELAHRRLAILDLSPGAAQPMHSADRLATLVYNGEIYNYRELRAGLVAAGVALRTSSDTEVILELWRREGAAALSRLRGMFALALWDAEARELVLARDPYGIKPLYYATGESQFLFASQVRALTAVERGASEIDPEAVAGFLAWGFVPEPRTLHRAIRALPAGHLLRVDERLRTRLVQLPAAAPPASSPADAAGALEESVRAHLVADVPVALFLSAGLDSALIAALARRAGSEPPVALTLSWDDGRGGTSDEESGARATAQALGLRHEVGRIAPREFVHDAGAIFAAMDQPSIDGFNTWLIAKFAAASGCKVALSGLGGDELLGGYRSFRAVPRLARWRRRLPDGGASWRRLARRLSPSRPKLAGLFDGDRSLAGAYALVRGLHLPDEIAAAGGCSYDPRLAAWECLGETTLGSTEALLADPWLAVHRLESQLYLRNQLLRDADWAGMAHGVEIRAPLVDARLRAQLERLRFEPARSQGKAAAIRAACPELPEALFRRPKTGFQLPIADWLDGVAPGARRPVGLQSRRLARLALEAHGVAWPLDGVPEAGGALV